MRHRLNSFMKIGGEKLNKWSSSRGSRGSDRSSESVSRSTSLERGTSIVGAPSGVTTAPPSPPGRAPPSASPRAGSESPSPLERARQSRREQRERDTELGV